MEAGIKANDIIIAINNASRLTIRPSFRRDKQVPSGETKSHLKYVRDTKLGVNPL